MGARTATARLEGDGMRFIAITGSGHSIAMDNAQGDTGARPAEPLLVAQAGSPAMDVIAILRKQRQVVAAAMKCGSAANSAMIPTRTYLNGSASLT